MGPKPLGHLLLARHISGEPHGQLQSLTMSCRSSVDCGIPSRGAFICHAKPSRPTHLLGPASPQALEGGRGCS